jgi:Ca-activated chloride channel family protein
VRRARPAGPRLRCAAALLLTAGAARAAPAGLQWTLFGQRMRVLQPLLLWLAPLGLLGGLFLALRSWSRQQRALRLVPPSRSGRLLSGASAQQGVLRGGSLGLGVALLFVAAAGPQCGERTELVKRTGVDLVIALDASASMLARDMKPSRLERARLEISTLLDHLKGDRVGLVVFAGEAFVQCPLTVDYSAAKLFLRAVDPLGMPQQGTALAAALRESRRVLDGGGRTGAAKVVLVLSDGEDHEGEADAAAQELNDSGIRVYTVALGSETGEPIPLVDAQGNITGYKKDREGKTVLTRTDVAGLRDLAARGGGQLLRDPGGNPDVQALVEELSRMQRGDIESRLSVQYDDRYRWFAWPAFALLLVGLALGEGPLRAPWRRGG